VPVWQAAWEAQLEDHIISLAWSPDGQWVAAAVVSGPIKIFYAKDGAFVCPLKGHCSGTSKVGWSADGKRFASAGQDGKTKFWDLINGRELRSIAWSPNGNFVASGNQDATVHFWFIERSEELQMAGYPTKVRELSWDFTSRYLATGGGQQITVWDCTGKGPDGSRPIVLKGHQAPLRRLAYQPRGIVVASGADDGMVAFWQPTKQNTPVAIQVFDDAVTQIAWSPDSGNLAAGSHGGLLKIIPMLERER
jgi:WD40 repeat protein